MTDRAYQYNFSSMVDGAMYNRAGRERKAQTIVAVLRDFFSPRPLSSLKMLDVGSSTGIIDNFLADHFASVTGGDIDKEAVAYAGKTFRKDNLRFMVSDVMKLNFPEDSFDCVICTQIYEHVPDADRMAREIYRVLNHRRAAQGSPSSSAGPGLSARERPSPPPACSSP